MLGAPSGDAEGETLLLEASVGGCFHDTPAPCPAHCSHLRAGAQEPLLSGSARRRLSPFRLLPDVSPIDISEATRPFQEKEKKRSSLTFQETPE